MPNYWLVKTEPSTYSFDDLEHDGATTWDGVKNPVAQKHLRAMQPGDDVLFYHTGNEKSIVGLATVAAAGDPPKLKAKRRQRRAVTLAEVKKDKAFADLALVRIGRLSVMPVPAAQYRKLLQLGGDGGD
ncbi:MAG TPA: EVE domain-containing protein [Gemmatimonadales bacterium]|jgi:predicted RNA-binding protein with PUA-like domain|nr:EVE domain-containing protein [Gemmatimonadales bacterium]